MNNEHQVYLESPEVTDAMVDDCKKRIEKTGGFSLRLNKSIPADDHIRLVNELATRTRSRFSNNPSLSALGKDYALFHFWNPDGGDVCPTCLGWLSAPDHWDTCQHRVTLFKRAEWEDKFIGDDEFRDLSEILDLPPTPLCLFCGEAINTGHTCKRCRAKKEAERAKLDEILGDRKPIQTLPPPDTKLVQALGARILELEQQYNEAVIRLVRSEHHKIAGAVCCSILFIVIAILLFL